jgi:hypothetical protein
VVRKLLRNAGLALIFLPEPFTTPLGLALLGVSYIFAHFDRVDTPAYLRGFIKMYLKETSIRGGTPGVIQHKLKQTLSDSEWRYRPAKDVRYDIDSSRLLLRFDKDMNIEFDEPVMPVRHNMKHRWADYVWPGTSLDINTTAISNHIVGTSHLSVRFLEEACGGARKPVAKTVKHTLDIDRLVLRGDTASPAVEKAIHHSMKHDLYGYVQPSVPVYAETTVVHTMNNDRLMRQYEASNTSQIAADKTVVHNIDRTASGFPVHEEKEVVHAVNRNGLLCHYEKTMPGRSVVVPEPKVHAFNPAKMSLALGIG